MVGQFNHICGFYYTVPNPQPYRAPLRQYLPPVDLSVHTTIVSSTSRTVLTQNFVNPATDKAIPELRYTFPLYDGVSVVGFTCTINKDRVVRGVVKERNEARKTYQEAVDRGETAGLLEQLPEASDVFTTTVGNVPAGAELRVEITYLGELKHDAEADGIRFTIPTSIAPRYGDYPGEMAKGSNVSTTGGIQIVVDAEMPRGSNIKNVQSPSHPISVTIGNTSIEASSGADMSLQKASATLSLGTTELGKDFILQVVAADMGNPIAVLEKHPTIPNHRAIMATLVPKFNLPSSRPEIVFVCDRSGSMGTGKRIANLKAALQIFLKSLPLGVKFNICSFGSHHELLFKKGSVSYDASSLEQAIKYVEKFSANFGGTEMFRPLEEVLTKRYKDMDLEVFLLTDGEIWDQQNLFGLINKHVEGSKGATRIFTLGIGDGVSHALIEGVARAGNGFAQTVMDDEKMNSKVVRMLKAALTPHIKDYTLEVKYGAEPEPKPEPEPESKAHATADDDDADFEMVEKVMDALSITVSDPAPESKEKEAADIPQKPISLFDPAADPGVEMTDASKDTTAGGKYAGVPTLSEPKLLQTPFLIPPLYPFNRTSVYLLLSSETTQKTPKSVILRGTSAHGPLELEIPVTVLSEPAETIHQLAARKAIRELEDGRGWIFHAKDAANNTDGKLLKDVYEGRFADMVEREAVRLGVTYQVGGKWCSFVAVEEKEDSASTGSNDTVQEQVQDYQMFQMQLMLLEQQNKQRLMRARRAQGGGSAPRNVHKRAIQSGGLSMPLMQLSAKAARQTAPPGAHRFGGGALLGASHSPNQDAPVAVSRAPRGGLASAAAPAPAPAVAQPAGAPAERTSFKKSRAPMFALAGVEAKQDESDDDDDEQVSPRVYALGLDPPIRSAAPARNVDAFESIVASQTWEGYWKWNESFLQKLGVDIQKVLSSQPLVALGPELSAKSDKLATALVLAFLQAKMADREEEWEMLVDKAYDWLTANVSNISARDYVTVVKGLLYSQ